jgi:8-oxo-dGTP diphosphatase
VSGSEASIGVAVAIIRRDDGRILLCQRPEGKSYPLKWEFPGGKLEPGETPEMALARELSEELEIELGETRLYLRRTIPYSDLRSYDLSYFIVESWRGTPRNVVFNDLRWIYTRELVEYDILEGNREICRILVEADVERSTGRGI